MYIYIYTIFMKNIALKLIHNHCILSKFQHQKHVLEYHWLISSCSQSKITGLQFANLIEIPGPNVFLNHVIFIIFLQIMQDTYNNYIKINGHKEHTFFKL